MARMPAIPLPTKTSFRLRVIDYLSLEHEYAGPNWASVVACFLLPNRVPTAVCRCAIAEPLGSLGFRRGVAVIP